MCLYLSMMLLPSNKTPQDIFCGVLFILLWHQQQQGFWISVMMVMELLSGFRSGVDDDTAAVFTIGPAAQGSTTPLINIETDSPGAREPI